MTSACPCTDCQDFRYNGSPNAALCHPLGCRCEVQPPPRSPYRRLLRNEFKARRYGFRDPEIARANIIAAHRLMREDERNGLPALASEREYDRRIWIAAREILMAQAAPPPVRPSRPVNSGPCLRCNGEGVIYRSNEIQGEYSTNCGCSHGMSDSHYA